MPGVIFTLDDERALDVAQAGAKAAWLARGRRAGLPVLAGVVVAADVSRRHLELGASVLDGAGSGAARLAIVGADPPEIAASLEDATADMSEPMVVRSSSVLEGGGEWSGAFTSYLDLRHGELATGLLGCWASAFTASTLERYEATGTDPAKAAMAVLVQPALVCDFGGTSRIRGDDIEVVAVRGGPGPLVQGWEPGAVGTIDATGGVTGTGLVDLLGADRARKVGALMARAAAQTGATSCEWGAHGDEITIFQLARSVQPPPSEDVEPPAELRSGLAIGVAATVRRFPGALGEELVLPWALGVAAEDVVLPDASPVADLGDALRTARETAATLAAQAWDRPKRQALASASAALRELRGPDPASAMQSIGGLRRPDPELAAHLLVLLGGVAARLVVDGVISRTDLVWHVRPDAIAAGEIARLDRVGFDRWEPFTTAVVGLCGVAVSGASAAPGVASGRMCIVLDTEDLEKFRPRDVLVSTHPVPNLAPLLWDASAVVTTGGSPAAHLFESARALAIPAVSGARIEHIIGRELREPGGADTVLAVDGSHGTVSGMEW